MNEQIKVKFPDGAEIRAVVLKVDDNGNYKCSAIEKTDKYKQGDIFYANENTHEIIKQSAIIGRADYNYDALQKQYPNVDVFALLKKWEEGMDDSDRYTYKNNFSDFVRMTANVEVRHTRNMTKLSGIKNLLNNYIHRKNVGFDIHKSPWKFNKITGKIEKDPEAIQKIAMRIKTALEYYPYEGLNSDYKHQERLGDAEQRRDERELKIGDEGMYHGAEVKVDNLDSLGNVEVHEINSEHAFKVSKDSFMKEFSKFPSKLSSLKNLLSHALEQDVKSEISRYMENAHKALEDYYATDNFTSLMIARENLQKLVGTLNTEMEKDKQSKAPSGSPDVAQRNLDSMQRI